MVVAALLRHHECAQRRHLGGVVKAADHERGADAAPFLVAEFFAVPVDQHAQQVVAQCAAALLRHHPDHVGVDR
ncbi:MULTISPECIES: hypothetical protein [Streptomyces]|uniref:hypothetical protein n=1 Tax=Streptomyces TaxID=1883 RepID=UPI00292D8C3E|nr:hypothetical protein [Streptomyces sp. NEAU-HV9]